jgi:hypothetical protein
MASKDAQAVLHRTIEERYVTCRKALNSRCYERGKRIYSAIIAWITSARISRGSSEEIVGGIGFGQLAK